jgi:hypothetical protein
MENDLGRYPGLLPILAIDFDLKSACVNALRWDTTGSNTPAIAVRVVDQAGSRWVGRVNRLFESRGRIVRAMPRRDSAGAVDSFFAVGVRGVVTHNHVLSI